MDAATAAASREREEMALMQQQHQQWLQAMMTAYSSGRMEEHAGGGAGGGGAAGGMVPTPHFMPAELVAHQQQAALVAAAAGGSPGIPMTAENLMEFQRQFDMMLQHVQEEPELLRHPQIQMMFQQRNRLVAMQQGAAMQEHMLNYQRMQLSLLQQLEMHKLSRLQQEESGSCPVI